MNIQFWEEYWSTKDLKYNNDYTPYQFKYWEKYLPRDNNLICLEIGCVPGSTSIFLNKKYGYKIIGVDYSEVIKQVKLNFELNEIKDYQLLNEDFLSLSTNIKADIIISLGFVEHFNDYNYVIRKHAAHLKKKGILIIGVPNFRYCQYYLHKIFDKNILNNHILAVMDPKVIASNLSSCYLKILESRYVGTFDYWCDAIPSSKSNQIMLNIILYMSAKAKKVINNISLDDIPNRYFSPFIICVAKNA